MFSLNKSLAKLKSALEDANLSKDKKAQSADGTSEDKQNAAPKKQNVKAKKSAKKNVCIQFCLCSVVYSDIILPLSSNPKSEMARQSTALS